MRKTLLLPTLFLLFSAFASPGSSFLKEIEKAIDSQEFDRGRPAHSKAIVKKGSIISFR